MKYINLVPLISGLTWTQVGTNPYSLGGAASVPYFPFFCIVNGYLSVLYTASYGGNPQYTLGAVLYSWDGLGNMCTYQTPDFNPTANHSNLAYPWQIIQNKNTFQWPFASSGTYIWTIPPIFQPGGNYTVPYNGLNIPPPCGAGTAGMVFPCAQQGLMAYEFVQGFGDASNIFAAIYDRFNNFKGGGFIGNYPNGQDGFNQLNQVLPPGVGASNIINRNGMNAYVGGTDNNFGFATPFLNGNPASLTCGTSHPNVFVSASSSFNYDLSADSNLPPLYLGGDSTLPLGITDLPGYVMCPDNYRFVLLSKDWFLDFGHPFTFGNYSTFAYIQSQKRLYGINSLNGGVNNGPVYSTHFDLEALGYGPLPQVQNSAHNGLVNYHRAVSPRGTFQT